MPKPETVQHAAPSWSNWLESVRAAAVEASGLRERLQGMNLKPELQATIQIDDVAHLAEPVDFAQAIGPNAAFAPAISGFNALILQSDPQGKGSWVDFAYCVSTLGVIQTYWQVYEVNPFTVDLTLVDHTDTGTRPVTSTLWWGQAAAIPANHGIKLYSNRLNGGADVMPMRMPSIYVPPGKHFATFSSSSASPISYGMVWRDV